MRKWNQGLENYAKIKYSKIDQFEKGVEDRSRVAMGYLMKNGYACLNGYAINEIINMIKSLKELKIEYIMRVIQNYGKNYTPESGQYPTFHYEFTLPYFEDDRTN